MVSTIGTSGFALKTQCNTDKSVLENKIDGAGKKIPYISGLIKKTNYNAKITESEVKLLSTNGLAATTTALNTVQTRYPM